MKPSPAPREGQGKGAESETSPGSLSRFKTLAARLFAVDPERFKKALAADEEERRAKRASKKRGSQRSDPQPEGVRGAPRGGD